MSVHGIIWNRFFGFDWFFVAVLVTGLVALAARQFGASKLVQGAVVAAGAAITVAVALLR